MVVAQQQKTGAFQVLVGKIDDVLQYAIGDPMRYLATWGRLYSLWPVHRETACCSVEAGAAAGSRFDIERFGTLEAFGSLRACDLIIVMGTVTRKLAPRLKLIYDQMAEPKWVIAMGACSITGGLYFDSYQVLWGIVAIIPVDVFVPGCPPRAEALIQVFVLLQEKIRRMPTLSGR